MTDTRKEMMALAERLEKSANHTDYPNDDHWNGYDAGRKDAADEIRKLASALASRQGEDARDANVERVRAKMLERSRVGLSKYGVTTERGDLSRMDWLRHLQEELMDAAVYVEAAMREGGG